MGRIEEKIKKLPDELQEQIEQYVDDLIKQQSTLVEREKPLFEWKGALKDLRDSYTAVELQHNITSMRINKL